MTDADEGEPINPDVARLVQLNASGQADGQEVIGSLKAIKAECDKGLPHKTAVAKSGAYAAILDALSKYQSYRNVSKHCFKALISLMKKQPDLLDDQGVSLIIAYANKDADPEVKKLALRWAKECCIKNEMNRQKIIRANILNNIKDMLPVSNLDGLKETLTVCRALVLDDDVRVQCGKSHERAKLIATETLCALTNLLKRLNQEEGIVCDIMLTLITLLVRPEFCKKVDDAGCLEAVKQVLKARYIGFTGTVTSIVLKPCTSAMMS